MMCVPHLIFQFLVCSYLHEAIWYSALSTFAQQSLRQLNQGDYDELYLIRRAEFLNRINKSYEKETTKIPKKIPVNFLTDWHYPIQGAFDNLYFKQLHFGDPKDS